jgi:hypothetical protein
MLFAISIDCLSTVFDVAFDLSHEQLHSTRYGVACFCLKVGVFDVFKS